MILIDTNYQVLINTRLLIFSAALASLQILLISHHLCFWSSPGCHTQQRPIQVAFSSIFS